MGIKRRSEIEIETMVKNGEATREDPRQAVKENATGRILSNDKVQLPETPLPPYLFQWTGNQIIYNDTDVEAFNQTIRAQTGRILEAMKDERFDRDGITYQQFLDLSDMCMAKPTEGRLENAITKGVDLYAVLESQGSRLTGELDLKGNPDEQVRLRFCAITDAHISLFFRMLMLNLAQSNQIDSVEGLLRIKLKALEDRLQTLLSHYIYADRRGDIPKWDIPASQTLYGWLLLGEKDIDKAEIIYTADTQLHKSMPSLNHVYKEVISIFDSRIYQGESFRSVLKSEFRIRGQYDSRGEFALTLCDYLAQTKRIRQYIEELTSGSEENEPVTATVDLRSLFFPRPAE